MGEICPLLH